MRRFLTASVLVVGLAACAPQGASTMPSAAAAPPMSEQDAIKFVDAIPAALFKKDIDGVLGLYADDAVLVAPGWPGLVTTKADNRKSTEPMLTMNFSKIEVMERKVQLVDADNVVVTQLLVATTKPGKKTDLTTMAVTDVIHRGADGAWKIVAEQLSPAEAPKTDKAIETLEAAKAG
jgi:uncharacterized protein (TIGR02246 family)